MPWPEAVAMSKVRCAFVHSVRLLKTPVAQACRKFGISRQTGYVWLRRFDADPDTELVDRSRRPRHSPARTDKALEYAVLRVRDADHWGARKIHAVLVGRGLHVPSVRTVHQVLIRHSRINQAAPPSPPPIRFERSAPNDLWQVDFMQGIEVARSRFDQLTIVDDHSRYLLAMPLVSDRTMPTAWGLLWDLFGEVGLPGCILCDNGFATNHRTPRTISWFEARLLRLGVRAAHGRPYHPQTQGKVERLHRTIREEFIPFARRDNLVNYQRDQRRWNATYNTRRPHEALGDQPPLSRWSPSPRPRPRKLPEIEYPAGSVLRRVGDNGIVRWKRARILAGNGLAYETVRVVEKDNAVELYLGNTLARSIPSALIKPHVIL
jgi:transposase InsO family protein